MLHVLTFSLIFSHSNNLSTFPEEVQRFSMWFQFVLLVGMFVVLLVLPSFCFFRLIRASVFTSLLLSFVFSIALYNALALIYGAAGIQCSFVSVFVAPCFVLAVACITAKVVRCKYVYEAVPSAALINGDVSTCQDAMKRCIGKYPVSAFITVLSYLVCGLVMGALLFVKSLDGPNSFISTYDNLYHYNTIRSLLESGYWSPIHTSCYLALPGSMNPMPGGTFPLDGYYPLGWHILVALLMQFSGCALPLAINVVNFVFASIVFPLGMFLLISVLFKKESVRYAGALCSCLCLVFPWYLLLEWPLFPNFSAFCLIPVLMASFVCLIKKLSLSSVDDNRRCFLDTPTIVLVFCFLCSCVTCAAIHPNSIFSAGILLIPFVVWLCTCLFRQKLGIFGAVFGFVVVSMSIMFAWVSLVHAESFQYVVDYVIPIRQTLDQAFLSVMQFSFTENVGQPLLFILTLLGIVALVRSRQNCWLIASFVLAVFVYVVSASCENETLRQVVSGFWYSEPKRTCSIVGLASLPLIACGLAACYEAVLALCKRCSCALRTNARHALAGVLAALFVAVIYFVPYKPIFLSTESSAIAQSEDNALFNGSSALQQAAQQAEYSYENPVLDAEEIAFLQEVQQSIGSNEGVINLPYDGSIIAYGLTGLRSCYLERYGYGESTETPESVLIRTQLNTISTCLDVQTAVNKVGCRYVLLLKRDKDIIYGFDEAQWEGINSINDSTPGFSVVLAKGDMRLYCIDAIG